MELICLDCGYIGEVEDFMQEGGGYACLLCSSLFVIEYEEDLS